MQRSSDSIGALATALAKAQSEIANPEKSLTATIVSPFPREGSRTFRYAALASGLDLVRKCLGRHEIATIQTTAMEKDSGLICLTTTLVHASGEWVASDWPVCSVSETATPHRLGAALTYARRYALFTLVGIAGEDDLDAPDLEASPATAAPQNSPLMPERGSGATQLQALRRSLQAPHSGIRAESPKPAILTSQASEDLRCRLISELAPLREPEALAAWAHKVLPLKNQLSPADAEGVEAAFVEALKKLDDVTPIQPPERPDVNGQHPSLHEPDTDVVVSIPKPLRERDRNHLRFVASQSCLICGRAPADAHHVKFAEPRATGRKVSDKFTVPLCRLHHRDLHRRGNERRWWHNQGIDPLSVAAALWESTHAETPSETMVGDIDAPPIITGLHLPNAPDAAISSQNNETKPILRPEAG